MPLATRHSSYLYNSAGVLQSCPYIVRSVDNVTVVSGLVVVWMYFTILCFSLQVQPGPPPCPVFHPEQTDLVLPPDGLWVLRFPYSYSTDRGPCYPPKENQPLNNYKVLRGILKATTANPPPQWTFTVGRTSYLFTPPDIGWEYFCCGSWPP